MIKSRTGRQDLVCMRREHLISSGNIRNSAIMSYNLHVPLEKFNLGGPVWLALVPRGATGQEKVTRTPLGFASTCPLVNQPENRLR